MRHHFRSRSGFCADDAFGICQAVAAVLALIGAFWSIDVLF